MDPDRSDAASLARELLPRLRRWDSASWSVPAALPGGVRRTRAEVAAAVLQRLADVNLADQLTVMVDDILRTGDPAALRTAATELAALRAALGYR